MAHRKKIESWLENDCKRWGDNIRIYLIDVDCSSYAWHIKHQNTVYEVTYDDIGVITLSSLPSKYWPGSFIREIYQGDNSEKSYREMIGLLSDNFTNNYI
jgi:hypothetical protein